VTGITCSFDYSHYKWNVPGYVTGEDAEA